MRETIRQKPWILAIAIIIVLSLWLLSGSFAQDETETVTTAQPEDASLPSVLIDQQQAQSITRQLRLKGRTEPQRRTTIGAKTEGIVTQVGVARGDRANTGDMLITLDMRDRQERLAEAQALVRLRTTELEARRALKGSGYASQIAEAEAEAALATAQSNLTRARLDLEYATARAPWDGLLHERHVEVGDYLKVGEPIAQLVDDHVVIVSAQVAETRRDALVAAMPGSAHLPDGRTFTGNLRYIAPEANAATRTFLVELALPNPDGDIPVGVTADMTLNTDTVAAHKVSPAILSLNSAGELGIKLLDDADKVRFYPANIVRSEGDGVWISGLPDPARIVVRGQDFVEVGQQVSAQIAPQESQLKDS